MISPSDLTYFSEVALTKNLSRASERLGISQPSLSLAIKRIEAILGTEVLIRSKKGVSLTKAGKALQRHAKILMEYWEQVKTEVLTSQNEVSGSVSIGCHPSVGLYSLEKFIPEIISKAPNLDIVLHHDISRKITERVISLEIDVGIVINPIQHQDLIITNVCTDIFTIWKSAKKTNANTHDLEGATLICDPMLMQTQDIINQMKKNGIKFSRIISSGSIEIIASLTAAGAGIGVIPEKVAKKMEGNKLVQVENAPVFQDTLSVIHRVENRKVTSIQYVVETIKNHL